MLPTVVSLPDLQDAAIPDRCCDELYRKHFVTAFILYTQNLTNSLHENHNYFCYTASLKSYELEAPMENNVLEITK